MSGCLVVFALLCVVCALAMTGLVVFFATMVLLWKLFLVMAMVGAVIIMFSIISWMVTKILNLFRK